MQGQNQSDEPKGSFNALLTVSKTVFILAMTLLTCTFAYLAYTNPSINYRERNRLEAIKMGMSKKEFDTLKERKLDNYSDVDTESDTYPIVVLQTGFKVLRTDSTSSLVGWKYEMANFSTFSEYEVKIKYKLQDEVGSSSQKERVRPKEQAKTVKKSEEL